MGMVLFDLDGTLIKGLSSEKRFFLFLLRSHIFGFRQLCAFLMFYLHWFRCFRWSVWKKNKAYLTDLKQEKIQLLANGFVMQALLPNLYPEVKKRLENHISQGDTVVLLTGAPDFIARPIAEELNIPSVAATVCNINGSCFTSLPPLIHPIGETKVQIAKKLCLTFGTKLDQCTAYSDSSSDIPLMTAVLNAVAVYPDRKLRQIAEQKGWEVIS